jgi:hypothetical protein
LDGRENKSEKTRTAVLSRNDKSQQQQQQNKKDEENIYNQPKKKENIRDWLRFIS